MVRILELEKYAKEFNIPIMEHDGIEFLLKYIKENNIKNILEIGSAIGYSAIRMCLIDNDIKVTTIERDENRYKEAKKNINLFNLEDRINIILDDAFNNMNNETKNFMLDKLSDLNKDGLTILNITSNLDTIYNSNQVYLLNNFKLENLGSVLETFEKDNYLRQIGLEIPFIIDLSIKLRFYGLIDKIYFNLEELEEDLWKSNS